MTLPTTGEIHPGSCRLTTPTRSFRSGRRSVPTNVSWVQRSEPGSSDDVKGLFLDYLDYYRETVAAKLSGLPEGRLRESDLPSGWSPIELVKHLCFMERRWLVWGFLGEAADDPWGDDRDGRWHVAPDESPEDLLRLLGDTAARTRRIVEAADLTAPAQVGGRFDDPATAPTLAWILFHVMHEYARHTGHLDIVRELIDGSLGE